MSLLPNNFTGRRCSPYGKRVARSHRLTEAVHMWISSNRDWLEREVYNLANSQQDKNAPES